MNLDGMTIEQLELLLFWLDGSSVYDEDCARIRRRIELLRSMH